MPEQDAVPEEPQPELVTDRIGRALLFLSKWLAALGGVAFCGLTLMQLVSIIGRKLFSMPVPGGYEVTSMVAAGAVASCLAYCHIKDDDVKIDFFTKPLGERANLRLDALGSLTMSLLAGILGYRAFLGALILQSDGEMSPILAWPIWVAQMSMLPGLILLTLVGLYMATRRLVAAHQLGVVQ